MYARAHSRTYLLHVRDPVDLRVCFFFGGGGRGTNEYLIDEKGSRSVSRSHAHTQACTHASFGRLMDDLYVAHPDTHRALASL